LFAVNKPRKETLIEVIESDDPTNRDVHLLAANASMPADRRRYSPRL